MQPSPQTIKRVEQSRINGAKSRGPNTSRGRDRARTAPLTHGLYATEPNLLPTVEEPLYAAFRQTCQSDWKPANQYVTAKVDDLVAYRWELDRLRAVRRQFLVRIFNDVASNCDSDASQLSIVCETEIRASAESGTLDRFDLRIRRCNLEISRIERDTIRLQRFFPDSGGSHNPLQTKEPEPSETQETQPGPIAWAEENFDIALDVHQADVLTAAGQNTILNAARYSGKTTALALRALYESERDPTKEIVCLSPTGALTDKIAELAAIGGYNPSNITDKLTGTAQLIVIDDAAELTTVPELNPQAQVIVAGTPKGATGYFFENWSGGEWTRIFAPAAHCDLIGEDLHRHAVAKLSESAYLQEFKCEFLHVPQPRCRLLPLTQ